jgi:GrpB-like predicted nucleotidyltransferase (UPF0157 family)
MEDCMANNKPEWPKPAPVEQFIRELEAEPWTVEDEAGALLFRDYLRAHTPEQLVANQRRGYTALDWQRERAGEEEQRLRTETQQ